MSTTILCDSSRSNYCLIALREVSILSNVGSLVEILQSEYDDHKPCSSDALVV